MSENEKQQPPPTPPAVPVVPQSDDKQVNHDPVPLQAES
jgi:hypothetical protein